MFQKIINKLLRRYIDRLENNYKQQLYNLEKREMQFSTADLVRSKMLGYDKNMLDGANKGYTFDPNESILLWVDKDKGNVKDFLAECHKLKDNWALPIIMDWNVRQLILHTALKAPNMETVNFSRASVNGVEIVREEISRLDAEYEERRSAPEVETYDTHAVI